MSSQIGFLFFFPLMKVVGKTQTTSSCIDKSELSRFPDLISPTSNFPALGN